MPAPLPRSMATGAPPAIAVSGAAAEMTKKAMPSTPRLPLRSWCSPCGVFVELMSWLSLPTGRAVASRTTPA